MFRSNLRKKINAPIYFNTYSDTERTFGYPLNKMNPFHIKHTEGKLKQIFSHLRKKSDVTKLKALEELKNYISMMDEDEIELIICELKNFVASENSEIYNSTFECVAKLIEQCNLMTKMSGKTVSYEKDLATDENFTHDFDALSISKQNTEGFIQKDVYIQNINRNKFSIEKHKKKFEPIFTEMIEFCLNKNENSFKKSIQRIINKKDVQRYSSKLLMRIDPRKKYRMHQVILLLVKCEAKISEIIYIMKEKRSWFDISLLSDLLFFGKLFKLLSFEMRHKLISYYYFEILKINDIKLSNEKYGLLLEIIKTLEEDLIYIDDLQTISTNYEEISIQKNEDNNSELLTKKRLIENVHLAAKIYKEVNFIDNIDVIHSYESKTKIDTFYKSHIKKHEFEEFKKKYETHFTKLKFKNKSFSVENEKIENNFCGLFQRLSPDFTLNSYKEFFFSYDSNESTKYLLLILFTTVFLFCKHIEHNLLREVRHINYKIFKLVLEYATLISDISFLDKCIVDDYKKFDLILKKVIDKDEYIINYINQPDINIENILFDITNYPIDFLKFNQKCDFNKGNAIFRDVLGKVKDKRDIFIGLTNKQKILRCYILKIFIIDFPSKNLKGYTNFENYDVYKYTNANENALENCIVTKNVIQFSEIFENFDLNDIKNIFVESLDVMPKIFFVENFDQFSDVQRLKFFKKYPNEIQLDTILNYMNNKCYLSELFNIPNFVFHRDFMEIIKEHIENHYTYEDIFYIYNNSIVPRELTLHFYFLLYKNIDPVKLELNIFNAKDVVMKYLNAEFVVHCLLNGFLDLEDFVSTVFSVIKNEKFKNSTAFDHEFFYFYPEFYSPLCCTLQFNMSDQNDGFKRKCQNHNDHYNMMHLKLENFQFYIVINTIIKKLFEIKIKYDPVDPNLAEQNFDAIDAKKVNKNYENRIKIDKKNLNTSITESQINEELNDKNYKIVTKNRFLITNTLLFLDLLVSEILMKKKEYKRDFTITENVIKNIINSNFVLCLKILYDLESEHIINQFEIKEIIDSYNRLHEKENSVGRTSNQKFDCLYFHYKYDNINVNYSIVIDFIKKLTESLTSEDNEFSIEGNIHINELIDLSILNKNYNSVFDPKKYQVFIYLLLKFGNNLKIEIIKQIINLKNPRLNNAVLAYLKNQNMLNYVQFEYKSHQLNDIPNDSKLIKMDLENLSWYFNTTLEILFKIDFDFSNSLLPIFNFIQSDNLWKYQNAENFLIGFSGIYFFSFENTYKNYNKFEDLENHLSEKYILNKSNEFEFDNGNSKTEEIINALKDSLDFFNELKNNISFINSRNEILLIIIQKYSKHIASDFINMYNLCKVEENPDKFQMLHLMTENINCNNFILFWTVLLTTLRDIRSLSILFFFETMLPYLNFNKFLLLNSDIKILKLFAFCFPAVFKEKCDSVRKLCKNTKTETLFSLDTKNSGCFSPLKTTFSSVTSNSPNQNLMNISLRPKIDDLFSPKSDIINDFYIQSICGHFEKESYSTQNLYYKNKCIDMRFIQHINPIYNPKHFNLDELLIYESNYKISGIEITFKPIKRGAIIVAKYKYEDSLFTLNLEISEDNKKLRCDTNMVLNSYFIKKIKNLLKRTRKFMEIVCLWKMNIDESILGNKECLVCFMIVSENLTLPDLKCKTCKNKFHKSCLSKWVNKGGKPICPLDRQVL
ncbi:hypothetical protein EDEG_00315 [Edhazardia aedis USNM 41457]|uniref:E3 ubiquitin-protein ligase listerin n=1 Tax=Edhazardia aedis (strain USNM 41457) TaxID=1003232 RepID=J9D323_EDHAE|nr:hypothetical protein EDEG_00315 [Edhazardia aedis USNM 41457]|eukprot:EJW01969.1 hypothetical protein EDEG_00315 [Edhazardia aedis USNM 41457]